MLTQLLTKEGEIFRVEKQLKDMIEQKKMVYLKTREKTLAEGQDIKQTRRDKRAEREMQKLKDKISEASGGAANFDELSQEPLNAAQMEESLFGIASEVLPTKQDLNSQEGKKYYINEQTGEK